MPKVSFTNLKLKVNSEVNTFQFGENKTKIEVLKYLPIEDKNDLIHIALQNAEEDGIYNDILLEMYFNLYIIYFYTNINFTDKQKEDPAKLYDQMQSNGLITSVIEAMDNDEYANLLTSLEVIRDANLTYKNTAAAVLQRIIQDLPRNAEAAAEIVNNWNPENFKEVQRLAQLANNTGMNNDKVVQFLQAQAEENK